MRGVLNEVVLSVELTARGFPAESSTLIIDNIKKISHNFSLTADHASAKNYAMMKVHSNTWQLGLKGGSRGGGE